ncbi:MAG TPA: glycosyltransferase family 1 protein [Flavobacterium sp.]
MRIILVGNYPPDNLESMGRFAQMLHSGFLKMGIKSEIWFPICVFGHFVKQTNYGFGKWIGYFDKFLIFPFILLFRLIYLNFGASNVHFHICDQGNAPYLMFLPVNRTVVTCHDVLAIRSALGYSGTYIPVSHLGRYYQKWIFHYLTRAKYLASVSHKTLTQLLELNFANRTFVGNWKVIPNGLNANFRVLAEKEQNYFLTRVGIDPEIPFLLHVGSDNLRKNRKLLVDMIADLGDKWLGLVCFAGDKIEPNLLCYAESLGLKSRVMSIVKPDHTTLVSLYNGCDAFIFPSFSEGFGWPVIEAQACGSPVIVSDIEPLREVGGEGAIYCDPSNPSEFARAFLFLKDELSRSTLIQRGFENSLRFDSKQMTYEYLKLHKFNQTSGSKTY